ncbi:MAG: glycosyltransferase [Sedimentisphaerales bacterium]|nr:glycosyltransferase [Sedimentisphaerales bacterium]
MKNGNSMKTCAVIVTYGNRFCFMGRVVTALVDSGIDRIVIVDNKSSDESVISLNKIVNKNTNISIVRLQTNSGSASGYKTGIEEAIKQTDCDFLWLLDDDNVPRCDALQVLKILWTTIDYAKKDELMSLVSFREDRPLYLRAVRENNPQIVLGRKNIFRAFHIADIIRKAIDCLLRKKNKLPPYPTKEYGEIYAAPYGGMFFNKKLIETIGYPNENYYLYVDDHEFSYRIIKKGGKMYLVPKSIVEDIDQSWHTRTDGFAFSRIARDDNYVRLYYSVRNRIYFEQTELVDNWLVYLINMLIYCIFVLVVALAGLRVKNIKVFFTAVYHGLIGKMERNSEYTL